MKCVKCNSEAEYVFLVLGTGGSFCKDCMAEMQKTVEKVQVDLKGLYV